MTALARRGGRLFLEEVPLEALAREHGTPLYAYSRSTLIERYTRLDKAFGSAPHLIAYAIKANMNLAVARCFVERGAGVDVTSRGELERALEAGAEPDRIVFSGVGKRADEIDRALEVGIRMLNLESIEELEVANARAGTLGKRAPVSFRLNPDVDPKTHPYISTGMLTSKFGVPMDDAIDAYERAAALPHIDVIGIDCHIGSQLTSLDPIREQLRRVKETALRLRDGGHRIELIDVGGGLGVEYSGHDDPPSMETYAETVLEVVGGLEATVVVEPGRSLTAGAGVLISRVLYRKQNPATRFVVIDAGMNDLLRPALYQAQMRIETDPERDGPRRAVDVVGPVCETTDRFARDRELPPLEQGDLVVFRDAGAYGFAMASAYNGRPLPAEVMVQGERVELVRRRQTIEETWRGEVMPDWSQTALDTR